MKTIEQLAREAGFVVQRDEWVFEAMLRTFAQLVRDDYRRELLAGVGEPRTLSRGDEDGVLQLGYTADQLAAAVLRERERCAKVCDGAYYQHIGPEYGEVRYGIAACAVAIRGETK